jgi:hypothetical protein
MDPNSHMDKVRAYHYMRNRRAASDSETDSGPRRSTSSSNPIIGAILMIIGIIVCFKSVPAGIALLVFGFALL